MSAHVLTFDGRGGFAVIYDDAIAGVLRALGPVVTRRASHVEPAEDGLSWSVAFEPWVPGAASQIDGHGIVHGPFDTRGKALAWERRYLEANL